MTASTNIQKWGNSQGIRIPKLILDDLKWNDNEELVLSVENDKIIIERSKSRKNIMQLFEDYDGEYTPVDIDWGEPAGNEIW